MIKSLIIISLVFYGFGFFTYGLLISLDKVRIEKHMIGRTLLTIVPLMIGMQREIERAIEDEKYILLIVHIAAIIGIISNYIIFRNTYNIFNLSKEDIVLCVHRSLDHLGLKYSVDNDSIYMESGGYINIEDDKKMNYLDVREMDDKFLMKDIKNKIKEEIYEYKLSKKKFYKSGYAYMTIGLFSIAILIGIWYIERLLH